MAYPVDKVIRSLNYWGKLSNFVSRARVSLFQQPVRKRVLFKWHLHLINGWNKQILGLHDTLWTEATMLNDGWPSSYVWSDLLRTPRDMCHVSGNGAVVGALASQQCSPGSIPGLGHWVLWFSPLLKNHHLQIIIRSWWCPEFVLCAKYLWHLNY